MWEYKVDVIQAGNEEQVLQRKLSKAGLDDWKVFHIERLDGNWTVVYERVSANPDLTRALFAHAEKKVEAG